MSILPEAAKQYIGLASERETGCDPVERGAVRRYAQAIMDENPVYSDPGAAGARFEGAVAPPIFPMHMSRRPFGAPDPLQEHARNPDFDGLGTPRGLPEIEPLKGLSLLNGGSEIEFYRYARHGETVTQQSRYASITEKETSKGPIILVVIESEYRTGDGELLIKARRTHIRR
jgi:acyl dehydratase